MADFILALDQGTTSSRAILFRHDGTVAGVAQQEFQQHYPRPGLVEHDPEDLWRTQTRTAAEVLQNAVEHGYRDGDTTVYLSYAIVLGAGPDSSEQADDVVELLRAVHDRL